MNIGGFQALFFQVPQFFQQENCGGQPVICVISCPWSQRVPQEIRGQNGSPGGLGFKIATLTQPTTLPSKLNIIPSDFFEAWLVRFVSQLEPGSCNHNFNASSGTKPAESETSPSLHHDAPNQPWASTVAVQLQLRPLEEEKASKSCKPGTSMRFQEISRFLK